MLGIIDIKIAFAVYEYPGKILFGGKNVSGVMFP